MKVGQTRRALPVWLTSLLWPWIAGWGLVFRLLEWFAPFYIIDEIDFNDWPRWRRAIQRLAEFAFSQSMLGFETTRIK